MTTRAAAADETRDRIVDAALELFSTAYYDEVTLRELARTAGVAVQTVVNHFGSKEGVFAAGVERWSAEIAERRDGAPVGDVPAAVAALVGDYEITGDAVVRALAIEGRVEVVGPMLATGRRNHRAWLERVFPAALAGLDRGDRRRRLAQLHAATDVVTWKVLRRDQGLSRAATVLAMTELVAALHPSEEL